MWVHSCYRKVPARQPCSGKAWCMHHSNPGRSDREQSLILIRVERGEVSAWSFKWRGLRDVPLFMLSVRNRGIKFHRCTDSGIWCLKNWTIITLRKWPAAAVIPAPIAYIKVVAVKKLVVEPWVWLTRPPNRAHGFGRTFPSGEPYTLHWV